MSETEKFSFYRHFAEKDSTTVANVEQVHQIVSGATAWDVWVRARRDKPSLEEYTNEIRDKRQMMIDEGYDKAQVKREFAEIKKALLCVAWSCFMTPSRNKLNASHHSGLICVDFDNLDADSIDRLWKQIIKDKQTLYAFLSPSGAGVKVVARVSGQESWLPKGDVYPQSELNEALRNFHAAAVEVVWKHYEHLGVEIDEGCKDISRLCFLCFDKEAYYNPDAEAIPVAPEDPVERAKRKLAEKAKAETKNRPDRHERSAPPTRESDDYPKDDSGRIDSALAVLKPDEPVDGVTAYKFWLDIGMALHSWDEEEGLEKWRSWSSTSKAYDPHEIEKKWDGFKQDSGVTLGTLFEYAKQCGWESPRREKSRRGHNVTDLESMLADRTKIDTSKVEKMNNRGLMDFADLPDDHDSNILGYRWLVRNAAGVVFAPSGVGKSTTLGQASAAWSLGEEAFGIKPSRPLKIVIFQSEDDDYDLREITAGVRHVLGYSKEDCAKISSGVRVIRTRRSGLSFIKEDMLPALEHYKPDLVIINPIMSFIGGDLSKQELAQQAFRTELGAVMEAYNVGVLFVHHTGKTQNLDFEKLSRYQAQYLTFGSSDLVNMIRCQLFIWPTDVNGVFGFHALKRAEKIGWFRQNGEDEAGQPRYAAEFTRYFKHYKCDQGTAWMPADAADLVQVEQARKNGKKRSGWTVRDKSLTGLRLMEALEKSKTYETKEIVVAVQNYLINECGADQAPSKPTIERAIREAVSLGLLERLQHGRYRVSIPSAAN
ncbi:MAG: AAA family ATPase [Verrucomicrobiae bacterium]|nr:AAA family ATPase [Verrucomicrobiae bacterium]